MTARHIAALVVLWCGVGVVGFSAIGALIVREFADRLHFLSPAAVLGAPLVIIGVAIDSTPGRTMAKLIFIAVLLAASGPVTAVATARAGPQPSLEEIAQLETEHENAS